MPLCQPQALGRLPLASITKKHCEKVQAVVKSKRSGAFANRVMEFLSAVLAAGVEWERRGKNVCLGVEKFHEQFRETFLTPVEL